VFSDEVYRELEHDPAKRLPPACDEYERAVSTAPNDAAPPSAT
jgi:hypothetical protein